jgi:hypothetical protein
MTAQMVGATWSSTIFTTLTASNPFIVSSSSSYTKYGIGINVASNGMTYVYVVFSI